MSNEIFVDGVGRVDLVDGLVRLSLSQSHFTGDQDAERDPPTVEEVARLVMTPASVQVATGRLTEIMNDLVERGVVARSDDNGSAQ